jgi:hypothetical protein
MGTRHTTATSRCSVCYWRRWGVLTTSKRASNLQVHDNVRATKITGSIGSAVTRGAAPGELKIDLPRMARSKPTKDFEDRNII